MIRLGSMARQSAELRQRRVERAAVARELGRDEAARELRVCAGTIEAAIITAAEMRIRERLAARVRHLDAEEIAAYEVELSERRRRTGR